MEKTDAIDIYKLMSQTVIPRPIAWIVTEDGGVVNIAPFSYFIPLSSNPPSLIVSVGHKNDGSPKDTLFNIRKHKRCTICTVEAKDLEKMHLSSKGLAHGQSEAEAFGIETETLKEGFPPAVKGTAVAYFCALDREIDLGGGKSVPLLLRVKEAYVDDRAVIDEEKFHFRFDPVARIGKTYAYLGEEVEPPSIP